MSTYLFFKVSNALLLLVELRVKRDQALQVDCSLSSEPTCYLPPRRRSRHLLLIVVVVTTDMIYRFGGRAMEGSGYNWSSSHLMHR